MSNVSNYPIREASIVTLSLLSWQFAGMPANANPQGGTVSQGSANISINGNTETINTSSANTFINWSSFNIGAAETTTFIEPSSTSVVWNNINSSGGMSQIMGTLNANGYVILQNASGFQVGGSAAINAGGLIITTAAAHPPSLSSGGAWEFDSPPPTAQILNYGKINISGGGSAFLIAGDIVNEGTGSITAEGGKVGLYAGEKVLVSLSPDGRGLSAQATMPQGSVDNEGRLIADGGTVAIEAQTVNQNGLAQANTVQNVNGVVELVAGNDLNVGASSDIEANGDATSANATTGGFVVLQSGNTYEDTVSSTVNVNGQNGGQGGIVEVIGNGNVQSSINGAFATLNNPSYITISGNPTDTTSDPANPNFNISDLSSYGQVDLHALDTIELSAYWLLNDPGAPGSLTLSAANNILVDPGAGIDTTIDAANYWDVNLTAVNGNITYDGALNLANGNATLSAGNNIEIGDFINLGGSAAPSSLSMLAGNDITLDDQTGITVGNNWNVNMVAGAGFDPTTAQSAPSSGNDGIYLTSSAFIQTQNGDINLWAANEVQVTAGGDLGDATGSSGITTQAGGNINVMTEFGDVNTGLNPQGFTYAKTAPYYSVNAFGLGGISTAAGGNVTINAGGNVISYLPSGDSSTAAEDGGTGAFGPEAGNVTITAGENVYGHYVLANGVGSITAQQDVGAASGNPFALSLINGSWTVNANDNIYLQEVRNPNGVFNSLGTVGSAKSPGNHLFDYGQDSSLTLDAGDGVYLTGLNVPRPDGDIPILLPPSLYITAGAGGVTLEDNFTLFPSPDGNLEITTTDGGDLVTIPNNPDPTVLTELLMSDSSQTRWIGAGTFGPDDHGSTPTELNNPNPVVISVSGNMENFDLETSKATDISVVGNMINCGFSGENLHASDTTSIKVGGTIFNQGAYSFVTLPGAVPLVPAADLPPNTPNNWATVLGLLVSQQAVDDLTVPANATSAQLLDYALSTHLNLPTGFVYNQSTGVLGWGGQMPQIVESALTQPLTVLKYGSDGLPLVVNGHFVTDTISWVNPAVILTLFNDSQGNPSPALAQLGYRIGGPGLFDVSAGSISLGNSYGILSCGVDDPQGGFGRYSNLASLTPDGATLDVTVSGDLDMLTSTIASLGGGDVNVTSTGGSLDLGSEGLANSSRQVGYGVFTSGGGDVNVTALDDINVDGSRIATYNGGDIFVESLTGNVDVGTGGDTATGAEVSFVDPTIGKAASYSEEVYGNGIVADTLVPPPTGASFPPDAATAPGNITVYTPRGNITASLGGITQQALDGSTAAGPVINLTAGTPAGNGSPGYAGNINLGQSGVIGGTVNLTANGNITGLIISRQNSNVNAAQNFNGSVLAGGSADVAGGGTVSGIIVGVGGANVSGGGGVTATVLSQNASVNGASSTSTLGATAAATSTSASAANQSSSETKELASTDTGEDDKKKKNQPLMQRVKRVTVILPKT